MKKYGAFLIGVSDCGQEVCAASGRISTQSGTALEIFERSHDEEKNTKLIDKVTRSGHTSTIEHVFFNLAFENVSVVVEQFMIEFRLASFTVKSRRYVDFANCGYLVPDLNDSSLTKIYTDNMDYFFNAYSLLCQKAIPKEDARFVLPYCFYSNFYCSLNGRELINVLRAMIYGRGSKIKEIHEIGLSLLSQCRKATPGLFVDFESRNESYLDEVDFGFSFESENENADRLTEILSYTKDGEKNIAAAALIESCGFSGEKIDEILSDEKNTEKIISLICKSQRPRALESFNCTVRFNGVSLSCLTHFARHRIQSICIPNLINASRKNYIIPKTVSENEEALNLYISCFDKMNELYTLLKSKDLTSSELIYCVLSGNTLDFVSTMNGRELLLFFRLRSCTRAQWEIQNYCRDLLPKLKEIAPVLFKNYGPSCYVTGKCPEGKFSCGKVAQMKEYFGS
ncbi:MAG: FAD-dependent thymidylate synthase [Acutalibacteraceae bacterium]